MELIPMVKSSLSDSVKSYLYQYIKNMDTSKGTKLQAESVIAKNLSVSRVTVRRAFDDLEQEGVVFRIHGKGTFVNPEALQIKVNLNPGEEFSQVVQKSGYHCRVEIVRFEEIQADQKLAEFLQISQGEPVYLLEKVYFADNHPAIISIDRFPKSLFPHEDSAIEGQDAIFNTLRQKAGRIVKCDKIEIETMNRSQMSLYSSYSDRMECSTVLVFHGINYDQDNRPVIYDTEFYDTNYIRFNMMRVKHVFEDL